MHPGLLALVSGGLLYIASAAVGAMQASGTVSALAWLGVAAVALCHAAQGYLVIGGQSAVSQSFGTIVFRVGASVLTTALILAAAIIAVSLFPLPLDPNVAWGLVALSVLASVLALRLAAGRSWRD